MPEGSVTVPVVDLLNEQTDLTPARHVPETAVEAQAKLHESWGRLGGLLDEVRDHSQSLAAIDLSAGSEALSTITVSDLHRAHALKLQQGQTLPSELLHGDALPDGAVPALSVPDLVLGGQPGGWLARAEAERGARTGSFTVAEPGDVVVAGVERAYRVWVQEDTPLVLGPQLYALRPDPEVLDPGSSQAACVRPRTRGKRVPTLPALPASTYASYRCSSSHLLNSDRMRRPSENSWHLRSRSARSHRWARLSCGASGTGSQRESSTLCVREQAADRLRYTRRTSLYVTCPPNMDVGPQALGNDH